MLQFCPNGDRVPGSHPAIPYTPDEVAREIAAAYELGVDDAHIHVRNAAGHESMAAGDIAAALEAIRAAVPGRPIGIRTSDLIVPDQYDRAAVIETWEVLPDHATVNWHEPGAERVSRALLDRGIAVHAGVFTGTIGVERFLQSGLAADVERVLIEITEADYVHGIDHAMSVRDDLLDMGNEVLLHGQGALAWQALDLAIELGVHSRIGIEDTVHLPDGTVAPDNLALVRAALDRTHAARQY